MSVSKSSDTPLGDDEIDELADLVDLIDERTDLPLSLEGMDGFLVALACSPRAIPPGEYFPVLLDRDGGLEAVFENESDAARFLSLFTRRRNEIARALAGRYSPAAATRSPARWPHRSRTLPIPGRCRR